MNFVLTYKSTSGGTTVIVNVRNTGNVALQSYSATFTDTVTAETIIVSGNKFGNAAKVSVGNIGVVSSNPFSVSTIGHQIKATVKACSEDGQAGKCTSKTITFESN
jgi:histidinol dehydrogenase